MATKILMLQGTMSNVGKTFLTAGFCRVFSELGYKVSPFKAQNLSDKSAVLEDGTHIGVGQAVQARAAGIKPTSYMNPFLLKANADDTFSAYLHGRLLDKEESAYYFSNRKALMDEILKDFKELAKQYDLIIIEGAGCPAEPNLQENDIANMGFARTVGAPVLLVGDIERGGVFASLSGTVELLSPEDRKLVKGFIINKFDGDIKYLSPAPEILKQKTGLSLLGVISKLNVCLEEEDISFSYTQDSEIKTEEASFKIIADEIRKNINIYDILALFNEYSF